MFRPNRASDNPYLRNYSQMKKIKHPPLYIVAKEEIQNYIDSHKLKAGERLPPENEMTQTLGISRGTLREAMRLLEEKGVVQRRQGVGTIINPNRGTIDSTLDINESVSEMIEGKGLRPGALRSIVEVVPADRQIAAELDIEKKIPVARLSRVRTADGNPVAYTADYIPASLVGEDFFDRVKKGSLYTYIEDVLGLSLTNSMLRIEPLKASSCIARNLEIKPGSLLMLLKQTDKNSDNMPIIYSEEYFIADRFEFFVLRKRNR
jgi:GntR family transcriptional regulator